MSPAFSHAAFAALALCLSLFYVLGLEKAHHLVFYAALLLGAKACFRSPPRGLWLLLAYAGYQAASLGWSPIFSGEELGEVLRRGALTLAFVALVGALFRPQLWEILVTVAGVSAACALYLHFSAIHIPDRMTGFGRSLNPVQGAGLYAFALAASLPLIRQNRRWALCSLLLLAAVLATGSRGALLAALAAGAVYAALEYRRFTLKHLGLFFLAVLAGGSLLFPNLLERADSFRLAIWQEALAYWIQHPLLGLGYRTPFEMALSNGEVIFQPHSIYVTALYYGGLVGLALLLAVFAFAGLQAWRARDHTALALLAFAITLGLFDYNLLLVNGDIEWLLFWFPVGLAWQRRECPIY